MRASIDAIIRDIELAMAVCTDWSSIDWKEEVPAAGGDEVEWVAQLVGGPRTVAITVAGGLRVGGVPPGDEDGAVPPAALLIMPPLGLSSG